MKMAAAGWGIPIVDFGAMSLENSVNENGEAVKTNFIELSVQLDLYISLISSEPRDSTRNAKEMVARY